jgi:hypothetical protein
MGFGIVRSLATQDLEFSTWERPDVHGLRRFSLARAGSGGTGASDDVHGLRRFSLAICSPVLHVMGWVGRRSRPGRFVDDGLLEPETAVIRLGG